MRPSADTLYRSIKCSLSAMAGAVIFDEAVFCGQPDSVDHECIPVLLWPMGSPNHDGLTLSRPFEVIEMTAVTSAQGQGSDGRSSSACGRLTHQERRPTDALTDLGF
jgi:hypothetical protein